MRFLSVVPATLLAITSFVSAVPTAVSVSAVSARDNESGLQGLINAFGAANTELPSLSQKLSDALNASPADVATIGSVSGQIDNVITSLNTQVKNSDFAAATPSEASQLNTVSYGTIQTVETIVNELLTGLKGILTELPPKVEDLLENVLTLVQQLVNTLQSDLPDDAEGILDDVDDLLEDILTELQPAVDDLLIYLGLGL